MTSKSIFAAVTLLLTCATCSADVIYEWEATNHERPWAFEMRLVFDDAAFNEGVFSTRILPERSTTRYPNSGLISISWGFNGSADEWSYRPRTESPGYNDLDMQVTFGKWGIGSGYISMNNSLTKFTMSGGNILTITAAAGDGGLWGSGCALFPGYGYAGYESCNGAQGRLRQIPEPSPLTLLGLGVVGLATVRSRKKKR